MKFLILMGILFSFEMAHAITTIKVPVYLDLSTDYEEKYVTAHDFNKYLEVEGKETFPEYYILSSADKNPTKSFEAQQKNIFKIGNKILGEDFEVLSELIPNDLGMGTCYSGESGQAVVDLLFALTDIYYTEQMNLWGYRYKQEKSFDEYALEEFYQSEDEFNQMLDSASVLWKNWAPQKDVESMLILVAYSDDGDDVNEIIVPVCD